MTVRDSEIRTVNGLPSRATSKTRALSVALMAVVLCGCGGTSSRPIRPRSRFLPEHARFFDDTIDLVRNPEGLGGRWATEWAEEIHGRIENSDLIARVRIEAVSTETDAERHRRLRLSAHVIERIRGRVPSDRKLILVVSEGSDGWQRVVANESELLERQFIVFVKWYTDRFDELRSHWHLSPATRSLVATIRTTLEDMLSAQARTPGP